MAGILEAAIAESLRTGAEGVGKSYIEQQKEKQKKAEEDALVKLAVLMKQGETNRLYAKPYYSYPDQKEMPRAELTAPQYQKAATGELPYDIEPKSTDMDIFYVDQETKKTTDVHGREITGAIPKGSKIITISRKPVSSTGGKMQSDLIKTFNTEAGVKKSQQSQDASKMIRELAISGNPIAANSIPTFTARASGEVGNLSEADKAPFGGSQAVLQRLNAAIMQQSQGALSQENKKFILELADIMEKRANENMIDVAKTRAKQYAKTGLYGTEQEILQTLIPDYKETKQSPIPGVSTISQKYSEWLGE